MRPLDLRSRWKKVLPWYYTANSAPARGAARKAAIARDIQDSGER